MVRVRTSSLNEVVFLLCFRPSDSELRVPYRVSNELSSPSPEDPPIWKVAFFRFTGVAGRGPGDGLRIEDDIEVGASCTRDRVDDDIWSFEKPRTMLVALTSVEVLSLLASGRLISEYSLPMAVATVDVDESGII